MKQSRWLYLVAVVAVVAAGGWVTPAVAAPSAAPAPAKVVAPAQAAPSPRAVEAAPEDMVRLADEMAQQVETLRGWKFKEPVKKQLCTPEHVRAYLTREIQKQCPPGKVERTQAMLRLLGLLPPDGNLKQAYLDILQEQVGGFYDTESKTLSLVKRDGKASASIDRILFVHELTHALDDQVLDLDKFIRPLAGKSEDMDLVVASVMEGSATSLMMQYMARAQLSGQFDAAELMAYAEEETKHGQVLANSPRYFYTMVGAYLCGMQFLARGNLLGMMLAPDNKPVGLNLQAAIKDPPQSSEQILHPEKYWDAAKRDDPVVIRDESAAKRLASPGRGIVHQDTVGEMLIAILTTPPDKKMNLEGMPLADSWTNLAAKGWGGDRFYLLAAGPNADAAGATLRDAKGVWITLWDTPADRDEFVAALEKIPAAGPRAIVGLGTVGAVVFFNFTDAERADLAKQIEQSPPAMLRGGKPWAPWAM